MEATTTSAATAQRVQSSLRRRHELRTTLDNL